MRWVPAAAAARLQGAIDTGRADVNHSLLYNDVLLVYCTTSVLLLYCYGTTVLLLYYYSTTAHNQGSDLVDCEGECKLEGKVVVMLE